ncbi:YopX family protein [Alkalihalophilus lindianensis]|uniref:YopX family protein n=1 Tax=Alkalihalophilus lindianensis TaxID=1630542 RepID=A0ABU3X7A7_9BACI|nr:YopX family protein [Alkalihalophilus lindianensis]MDV2683760.1 YopX family protein [Alkalihalophilus lindianensis]MDV2683826.1 YopX family protein [Alkalihalophilus lindianensis]
MKDKKFKLWNGKEMSEPFDLSQNPIYWTDLLSEAPEAIVQYTGLNDKNGTEVYEGDIVKISDHPFDSTTFGVNGNYEVGYNDQMELCCGSWLLPKMKHYAEVIGNIYEHPHLLERED